MEITSKYVAFADNDLVVERGCLAKLIACAEETGAGLVCPLYIEAGGGREPAIHMAGGVFHWADPPERGLERESHRLEKQPIVAAASLPREKVDFTEYHYLLGRSDLLRRPGAISDDVLLMHEHIDLGLFAREQGVDVVFEPTARVTYVAFEPRALAEIAFFRRRWDVEACRRSTVAFATRWPRSDPDSLIAGSTSYAASRLREVELRRPDSARGDLDACMQPAELAQSRYALREQAIARGYAEGPVRALETACDLATLRSTASTGRTGGRFSATRSGPPARWCATTCRRPSCRPACCTRPSRTGRTGSRMTSSPGCSGGRRRRDGGARAAGRPRLPCQGRRRPRRART